MVWIRVSKLTEKKQKVSKNSQKKLLKKMAKNSLKKITEKNHWKKSLEKKITGKKITEKKSLKKITEKKSLKKFKRIWSVFKLSKNLTIMYFVIVVAFWGHPLYWEVNKRQGLQWQSENKRHFCETGKVSTVFPRFFFAFKRKNRESEGRTSKSWLLSFNVGQFWRIFGQIAILELLSRKTRENSWKCWKRPGIWRFHEKFSSIWRFFSNFELRPSKLTKNSPIWRCFSGKFFSKL